MTNSLQLHPNDNVVTVITDIGPGSAVTWQETGATVRAKDAIPFGHKVATAPISAGDTDIKYGASIGLATEDIAPGQHVHIHNLRSVRGAASS